MKEGVTGELGFVVKNESRIKPLREADLSKLSDSDVKCLDKIIRLYGDVPFWKKTQDSHDEAYTAAWAARGNRNSKEISIESLVELLEDPEELLQHLQQRYKDEPS